MQSSVQFSRSVVSNSFQAHEGMPGLPVHHQLPEFTQTHVHWVSDAIQPSHPLSSPSLPALSLSQHHSLFQWLGSFHQVAKVLELYSVYMGVYSIIGYSNLWLRMYLCKSHCVLRAKPHLCLVECPVTCCNKGEGPSLLRCSLIVISRFCSGKNT